MHTPVWIAVQVLHMDSCVVLDGWLRLSVAAHHAVLVQVGDYAGIGIYLRCRATCY